GKGNYKGKLSRKFKIVKGSPGLYFAKKTVKRPVSLGSYTQKPKKKVKGKMTYTYSSSKPSVATVNKKTGKVTPKKIGTTVITVKNKATKNYKAGKATYKLTVRALTKDELKFNFANYITNEIPLSTFRMFYNPTQAKAHYRKEWNIGDAGVCFGMSAGSGMLRTAGSGLTPAKFKSGAKKPSQLSKGNRFKTKGVTLKSVIEAMHLSQAAPQCQKVMNKNTNNIKGLVATVKSGYPAIICMRSYWGLGGHAVEGYKYEKLNKEVDVIYVYDSSNFSPDGCIYLYKNNKGKYIDWYYSYYEGFFSPAAITYIPGKTYRSIWKNRKAAKKLGQMYVSSDNFKILGSDGKVVAEMKDGDFSSTSEDIFLAQTYDFEFEDNLVILPSDKYTVQDTSGSSEKLTVTSIDENQSIEVTTDATAVVVETVDDNSINKATLRVAEGESYEVSVLDGTGGGEPDEIVFTGEGTGKAITLGTDDGDCIVKNAGDVQLEINGVEKDFTVSGGVAEIK
ncbi:MAG: hypothetical protein IJH57_00785, partial [Mogibacterium sp.]|nr:hypothetical protein [Mogibacterium sp.]